MRQRLERVDVLALRGCYNHAGEAGSNGMMLKICWVASVLPALE